MAAKSLMCVLAHPDDETFGPGGTIRKCSLRGVRVTAVIATSGQAGRSAGLASTPEELGRVREQEARDAAAVLGIASLKFLGYEDGRLDRADPEELLEKIVWLVREEKPDVVLTFGPEGAANEHPDHKAISRVAALAVEAAGDPGSFPRQIGNGLDSHLVRKFYYMSGLEVPWRKMQSPFLPITTRIDISDVLDAKLRAFDRHRSQQEWKPRLLDWIRINGNAEPYHRKTPPFAGPSGVETDLFDGL